MAAARRRALAALLTHALVVPRARTQPLRAAEAGLSETMAQLEAKYRERGEARPLNIVDPATGAQCTWSPRERRVCRGLAGRCQPDPPRAPDAPSGAAAEHGGSSGGGGDECDSDAAASGSGGSAAPAAAEASSAHSHALRSDGRAEGAPVASGGSHGGSGGRDGAAAGAERA